MSQAVARLRAAWERAIERDRHADAIKALLELESLEPTEASWSHRLGDAYRRLGRDKDAASAFGRAMARYQAQGFLPRAIAMAKLAESLDPSKADLIQLLTPDSARALRPAAVPPAGPLRPAPLARAKDELPDEVRFEDDASGSSVTIVLEDVEVDELDELREPAPALPERDRGASAPREPPIDRLAAMVGFLLFADLDREALVALSSAAELVEFVPGAMVIMRDEPARALYAIVQGTARVDVRGGPSVRLGVGDVFGEACLLDEGKRQADVRAETPLSSLRIGKSAVDDIAAKFPEVRGALFQLLARRLVVNVVQTNPLFAAFEPSQRLELAQLFEIRRAAAGAVLAELGRKVDGLYVLLAGELTAKTSDGVETRVARGSTFGQGSLLGGMASDTSLVAATELVVLRLPASQFAALAALYPPALAHLSEIAGDPLRGSLAPARSEK